MDPNATLKFIREIMDKISHAITGAEDDGLYLDGQATSDLSELVDAWDGLDNWLKRGGFLPKDWKKNR